VRKREGERETHILLFNTLIQHTKEFKVLWRPGNTQYKEGDRGRGREIYKKREREGERYRNRENEGERTI